MTYYAHSAPPGGSPQTVKAHLSEVARLAREFAGPLGASDEAELAGLLHDIGKYTCLFQRRLAGQEHGLDHWSPGAWVALRQYGSIAAALAVQGHHVGLQRGDKASLRALEPAHLASSHPQQLRVTATSPEPLLRCLEEDHLRVAAPQSPLCSAPGATAAAMLNVRMLFSALVDADFLDTEQHFQGGRPRGIDLKAPHALELVQSRVARLRATGLASPDVQALRDDLWDACLLAGEGAPGLYTLSAPTGAGKTLAMLGFALRHAASHGSLPPRFRRVVVVIPYLSIIDQTVKEYRALFESEFGKHIVFAFHTRPEYVGSLQEALIALGPDGTIPDHRRLCVVGPPGADGESDGVDGEDDDDRDGDDESDGDCDGEDESLGDAEDDDGGGLDGVPPLPVADVGTGGGGCCCGAFWNSRIAMSTARHIRSNISSQDARIDNQPDRSPRPGQGSGHRRDVPGAVFSIQCRR